MSEPTRDPIGPEEVEAFYARQRRQVLDRLEQRPAGRIVRFPRRAWAWGGLAAAAALVLAFVALWGTADPAPSTGGETAEQATDDLGLTSLTEEMAAIPAELQAFGAWTDEVMTDDGHASEVEEIDSLAWLLEDEGTAAASLPEFLEPFGEWETAETDEGNTM